ncbi:MAG: hypothetical protein BM564_11205 [Bacteroidetes bacterium MedPE-SWsnd-G2]|nr:MAG: hypothetical protein BM564_11205 [Bacteroidetes bacterium MedPE-SWsnd-G2]
MLKKVFYKLSAMMLAIVVLFSSVSFTVDKHFCAGNLIDVSILSSVERCGGDAMKSYESEHQSLTKGCCKDVREIVEGVDVLNIKPSLKYVFSVCDLPQDLNFEFNSFVAPQSKKQFVLGLYNGPPKAPNLQVLYQSFLI